MQHAVLKIAMPTCISKLSVESIFSIANDRLAQKQNFLLLLDMSGVHQIEQEGLNRLYDMTQLMKSSGSPKIVIRKPSRVVRDALILSNTLNLFEIRDNV
jgi:anti-anti-sigma regulatory factor